MKYALAALALTLSGAAAASNAITDAEQAAIRLAIERGQWLYAYDQAAWHAGDAFVVKTREVYAAGRVVTNPGGYLVEGPVNAPTVTFYDRSEPPIVMFRAQTSDGGTKIVSAGFVQGVQHLTTAQRHLVAERKAVLAAADKQKLTPCASAAPNFVILPPIGAGRDETAYIMTPQTDSRAWPIGGHYRFDLTNGRPGPAQASAKTCLALSVTPAGNGTPEALVATHLLSETPTEIHAFTALAAKLPMIVITMPAKKLWAVEPAGGTVRIRLIDASAKP